MKLIQCYGSLKNGFHNNYRLGPNAKLIRIDFLNGVMYLHHNYPKLYKEDTRTGNDDKTNPFRKELVRTHQCEVWEVPDDVYESIHQMEVDSGYIVESKKVESPLGPVESIVFWMPWKRFNPNDQWIEAYTYEILPKDVQDYLRRNMSQKPLE